MSRIRRLHVGRDERVAGSTLTGQTRSADEPPSLRRRTQLRGIQPNVRSTWLTCNVTVAGRVDLLNFLRTPTEIPRHGSRSGAGVAQSHFAAVIMSPRSAAKSGYRRVGSEVRAGLSRLARAVGPSPGCPVPGRRPRCSPISAARLRTIATAPAERHAFHEGASWRSHRSRV